MNFDYYYGDESNQFAFYRIPRQLITGEAFKKLSTDAKLLYGLLLDRMGLSAKNGWYDDKVPSGTKAKELKKESQAGSLTTEKIEQAVAPTKREETPPLKVTMLEEDLRPFFPDKRTTIPDVKQGILEGLKLRQTVMERQKAKAAAGKNVKKAETPVR